MKNFRVASLPLILHSSFLILHSSFFILHLYMEVLCKIRDIYRAIAEFEAQFEQAYGLSLNEGMLLCTLLSRGKLSSSEVAEALGLSASNASKVIRSVESKELIVRQVGREDKRQMYFVPTPAGKELIGRIKAAHFDLPPLLSEAVGEGC
ncbi:regulatory protein MarR [Bacteroides sp. CAG:598]|nr:regulatory protein MarR [Bacteroides sp. CAG:598]